MTEIYNRHILTGDDDVDPFVECFIPLPLPLPIHASIHSYQQKLTNPQVIAIDNTFKTKICKMPPREPFNFDFDKKHGQKLIEAVQLQAGCFCCNKPDPDKTCSRCQVSMYCNQECQKTDWKKSGINAGHHKQLCKIYCENRAEQNGVMGPIPVCLYRIHLIDGFTLDLSMRQRSDLFL